MVFTIRETIKPVKFLNLQPDLWRLTVDLRKSSVFSGSLHTFGEVSCFIWKLTVFNKKEAIFRGNSHFHKNGIEYVQGVIHSKRTDISLRPWRVNNLSGFESGRMMCPQHAN